MAEDERLREALTELRSELDRSHRSASEAEAILRLSETLASVSDKASALNQLVEMTAAILDVPQVIVAEGEPKAYAVCASTKPVVDYLTISLDVTAKPRNLLDIQAMPDLAQIATKELPGTRSLLTTPLSIDGKNHAAILCAHPDDRRFTRSHTALLRRIARFASQTLTRLALSSQARLLSAVIDGSSSGFAIADAHDPERPLIFVNKAFEDLTGYSYDEVIGENCRLLSAEPPDSEERIRLRETVARNGAGRFLLRNVRKSGEPFWNDLTLFPVRNPMGETEYLVATQSDASERVAAQQDRDRAKEQQLMAQLAAGIAHDFNNLLSAINGSALLISTAPEVTSEIETHSARIAQAGNRAAKLVSRLLDLGSQGDDYHVFDLKEPLYEAIDLSRSTLGSQIELKLDIDQTDCLVRGSTTRINQIIVNLLLNARDAIGKTQGTISVALEKSSALPDFTDLGHLDPSRHYAQITITDDGPGMDDFTLGQIFEPYFTTKGKDGKGIGLAMVANLIRELDGALKVQSELGNWTEFTLWFPMAEAVPDAEVDLAVFKGRTILIVDDDAEAGEVLGTYLSRLGAEPSVLTQPELALEILQEDHAGWHAVITDYDMPGMTGGDLVGEMHNFASELPVFVVTALARTLSDRRLTDGAVKGIFEKPLDLEAFARAVAGCLERIDTP